MREGRDCPRLALKPLAQLLALRKRLGEHLDRYVAVQL